VLENQVVETPLDETTNAPKKVGGTQIDVDIHETDGLSDGILFYQTGNIDEFLNFIANSVAVKTSNVEFALDEAADILGDQSGGGKNKRNRTRRANAKRPRTMRKYVVKV
jgi:hypothetical protein